jgi:hypothetical protein
MRYTRDDDLQDALMCYEVARLTYRSLANAIAHRLAAGEPPTESEVLAEEESISAIVTARRRVLAAFARRDPESVTALTDNVIVGLIHERRERQEMRAE